MSSFADCAGDFPLPSKKQPIVDSCGEENLFFPYPPPFKQPPTFFSCKQWIGTFDPIIDTYDNPNAWPHEPARPSDFGVRHPCRDSLFETASRGKHRAPKRNRNLTLCMGAVVFILLVVLFLVALVA